jgi:guanylate kinase
MKNGLLVIISSPSGGGKDVIIARLLKKIPNSIRLTTTTTRTPRNQEKNGINYFFINQEEFKNKIKAGKILEYNLYADNYYGTEKEVFETTIKKYPVVFTNIDYHGKQNLDRLNIPHLSIFLIPESLEILENRIKRRGDVIPEQLKKRLETAKNELKQANIFDYQIVNHEGKLDETAEEIAKIIKTLDKNPDLI